MTLTTDRESAAWDAGHEQGWNDCLNEWQEQEKFCTHRCGGSTAKTTSRTSTMNLERFGFILAAVTLLALGTLDYAGVTGNLTESEPIGLYLKVPGFPARGLMVQLRGLIKHIAGVPGDTVRVTREGSYINGKLWPHSAMPADTNGYRPYPFGTYTLHPGQYWLLGSAPDSWDSRYLGAIPWDAIAFNIAPLWTHESLDKDTP